MLAEVGEVDVGLGLVGLSEGMKMLFAELTVESDVLILGRSGDLVGGLVPSAVLGRR